MAVITHMAMVMRWASVGLHSLHNTAHNHTHWQAPYYQGDNTHSLKAKELSILVSTFGCVNYWTV